MGNTTHTPKSKITKPPAEVVIAPVRPDGKLGLLVEQVETADGAMLSELATLTGWQKHTVRAALTRLRQRGFPIRLEDRDGRKAYRLNPEEG